MNADVASEAIELGNDQRSLVTLAGREGSLQLGTVRTLAALDLGMFGHELVLGVPAQVFPHRLPLRVEAEPAMTLPTGAHPIVRNERTAHIRISQQTFAET